MKSEYIKFLIWCLCASLWATICFIVPDFLDNPASNWKSLILIGIYICSIGFFQFMIISIVGINRYICSTLLPLYALLGSICSYYRFLYHISITPLLIDATFHTHIREAAGVVSIWLVVWLIVNIGISISFCYVRFKYLKLKKTLWLGVAICTFTIMYYLLIPRFREALDNRFPLNITNSIATYISDQNRRPIIRQCPSYISLNTPDSIIMVAVLGEAARADHLQLNGYKRKTTPRLCANANVVSLPFIYSQYTNTNGSVPHILTRADSAHTEYAQKESSFVTIFGQCGFSTIWLTNKNQNRPFMDFINEADTTQYTSSALKQSLYAKWLDEDLFPLMDGHLGKHAKQLFVLHTMGSHWLYDTHVPENQYVFQPIVNNRDLRQNSEEQIVNSYDNTIIYLDSFLDSLIMRLQSYTALVLYIADHGESLGEEGRYLHSQQEAEEEKNPAAIIWYSDSYARMYPEKVEALIRNKDKRYRTDYVFYSILYAAGIEAEGDCPEMNIFR